MDLPSGWYAICLSHEIKNKKLNSLKRFGLELVLFRNKQNKIAILDAICPHRGAHLKNGILTNDKIQCPYHGLRFSSSGHSEGRSCLKTYHSFETNNIIWMWWSKSNSQPSQPPKWFEDINNNCSTTYFKDLWPCHISRCIENQIDYTHFPFVHKNTIAKYLKITEKAKVVIEQDKMRWSFKLINNKFPNNYLEFRFPNIWFNYVNHLYSLSILFFPIDENHTEMVLQNHQNFITTKPFNYLPDMIFNFYNKIVLAEDRKIVLSQKPTSTKNEINDQLNDTDEMVAKFRQWLNSSI